MPVISRVTADATLVMPDGSVITLNEATRNSRITSHDNIEIIHADDGGLVYETQSAVAEATTNTTLNVPRGMTFYIALEDGTHVWLNADSKLHFPAVFGKTERRVILEGEGYFDVKSDSQRPFIVETANQQLTILGTQFNLSAYPDEQKTLTTLVEGSVFLSVTGGGSTTVLKPGQQAVLSPEGLIVNEVNTRDISIWRDGVFKFDGCTLSEVFIKLSRWYDFDYTLDSNAENRIFRGNIKVYEDVYPIFDVIEMVAQVGITMKGESINIKMTK
ncbi:MAG: FecR domain-containing protein [Rikenellaceae bacterium]|nr:FecR domain-containing protein [Rikenellaceae bacterium]MCL2691805.1 FecR domain-containing protein [Rikenellaceae bacterium]